MEELQAVAQLSALAQETRLRIFRFLVRLGNEEVPAGDLARELEIPPATLSFHLNQLQSAGLIASRREGRSIRYALRIRGIQELLAFLTEDCCQGRPELCAPPLSALDCC